MATKKSSSNNSTRNEYFKTFSSDNARKVMDCGTSVPENFSIDGKAERLFNILKGFPIGWKCEFGTLISQKWSEWNEKNPKFKTTDILTSNDVKKCIKYFYLAISKGELKYKDDSKRMLEFVMESTNKASVEENITENKQKCGVKIYLRVSEYKEIFKITTPEEKAKDPVLDPLVQASKKAEGTELEIINKAIEEIRKARSFAAVKVVSKSANK